VKRLEAFMKEERTITQFGRAPVQHLWWSSIFGGTFFALGIMLILGLFGVAVGAAIAGPQGAGQGTQVWAGIWSLVTLFLSFLAGGWLASATAGAGTRADGRMYGLVVWALGTTALFYFAVTSTTRVASILAPMTANMGGALNAAPGTVANVTVTAAVWALIAAICGLIGGLVGGHAGGKTYGETTSTANIRRAA
jgi:hypothetical protein